MSKYTINTRGRRIMAVSALAAEWTCATSSAQHSPNVDAHTGPAQREHLCELSDRLHSSRLSSYVDAGCWCCCSSSSSCDGIGPVACVSSSVSSLSSSSSNESLRIWSLETDEHACVKICAVMHVQIHLYLCAVPQVTLRHCPIVQIQFFSDNGEQLPMRPDPKLMSWHRCVLQGQKYQSGIDKTRKPSWCWHTRATQKRWKKFLHFEAITSSSKVGNPVFIVIKFLIQITSTYNNS